jgi:nicotinamide mononucleotide transporter
MSFIEVTGFIFGIAGIWLTLKQNIWCFPVGLINVIISMILFFDQKLYSDSLQQLAYIFLLSYGWYKWHRGERDLLLTVTYSSSRLLTMIGAAVVLVAILMGSVFEKYTDADVPYLDATATALSFAAQWMIARKKIENWLVWMAVNLMYIGIYIYKNLFLYAVLFFIYLILAIAGYMEWKKQIRLDVIKSD